MIKYYSCKFLLSSKLLWCPDRCRTSSCNVSKYRVQKQQVYRPPASGALMIFRCTEHKCFSKCAFCLNIATHKRHANGFSPVCTLKCVFKFHDMPNCLPQYSQRYSRTGAFVPLPLLPFPGPTPPPPALVTEALLLRELWDTDWWPLASLALSALLAACRDGGRPKRSAGDPDRPAKAPGGGHAYTNDGVTAKGLSALGGRLLLLLLWWWLFECSRSVGRWDLSPNDKKSVWLKESDLYHFVQFLKSGWINWVPKTYKQCMRWNKKHRKRQKLPVM